MINFNHDEKCILDIYRDRSRMRTMANISKALPHIEDPAMKELVKGVLEKLAKTDDRQYRALLRGEEYQRYIRNIHPSADILNIRPGTLWAPNRFCFRCSRTGLSVLLRIFPSCTATYNSWILPCGQVHAAPAAVSHPHV